MPVKRTRQRRRNELDNNEREAASIKHAVERDKILATVSMYSHFLGVAAKNETLKTALLYDMTCRSRHLNKKSSDNFS